MHTRKASVLVKLVIAGVLLAGGAALGVYLVGVKPSSPFSLLNRPAEVDIKATLSVLRSEAMSFLVTRHDTMQVVVKYSESDWLGDWDGVLWATVDWHWGVDLRKLSEKDLRREGDVLYCRLPDPELLSFGIEPGSEQFISKSTLVPKVHEVFNTGSQQKKLHDQIKTQAASVAQKQMLAPSRAEMVEQLNRKPAEFQRLVGLAVRFE